MFPLLGIIVAFILGLSYPTVIRTPHSPDVLGAVAVILAYALFGRVITALAVKRASAEQDGSPAPLFRAALLLRLGTLVAYAIVVYVFYWPEFVSVLGIGGAVLLPEIVIFLPFVVLLIIQLLVLQAAEAALGLNDFTARQYVAFHLRQYLLPVIPVVFFLIVADLFSLGARHNVGWIVRTLILYGSYPFLVWMTVPILLFLVYLMVPFLLRFFWRARSLPEGSLRRRLAEFSRREKFRARDLLLWPTGGNVLNAAVIGVAGPFRYVLITDGLIEELPEDEVEAVFAHEVGHAKHQHMLLFLLFTVGYVLLFLLVGTMLSGPVNEVFESEGALYVALTLLGFLAWFGLLFGFLSRRFEQQADVYGALATSRVRGEEGTSDPAQHPFVRALEAISRQMGDIREVKGWRHFSIAERVEFLKRFLVLPETRRRYYRGMRMLLALFFGLLVALGIAMASTVPRQIRLGRVKSASDTAEWLWSEGRREEAIAEEREAERRAKATEGSLLAAGDPKQARGYARRAVETGRRLAGWLAAEGRENEAISTYIATDEFAQRAGVEGRGEARVRDLRSKVMRDIDAAEARSLPPPERAFRLFVLAKGYLALGQTKAARAALSWAIEIAGGRPPLLLLLGQVLMEEHRFEGARLAFRDALAEAPSKSELAERIRERLKALGTGKQGRNR